MRKHPDTDSETLFSTWLDQQQIKYKRHYPVNPGNVDFLIESATPNIYCDVKEIRNSRNEKSGEIVAFKYLREDVKKLRQKFNKRPDLPVILVTMNYSGNTFTGWDVARALLGDNRLEVAPDDRRVVKPLHHHKGTASLGSNKNCSITGVFVFTGLSKSHVLFLSPFAAHPIGKDSFPNTESVCLNQDEEYDENMALTKYTFFPLSGYRINKILKLQPR